MGVFTAAPRAPKPGQTTFSIKLAFDDGNNVEHMWLTPVRFDGKLLHGKVDNTAEKVTNVKMGQEVSVEPSKISDWMFAENGRLQGGYTLRGAPRQDVLPRRNAPISTRACPSLSIECSMGQWTAALPASGHSSIRNKCVSRTEAASHG